MMKRNAIIGLALALAICATFAAAWKATGGNPGAGIISAVNTARFMLFGGSYNLASGQTESAVFKIDSYTGDTWILKVESVDGKRVEKWVAIQSQASAPAQSAEANTPGRLSGE